MKIITIPIILNYLVIKNVVGGYENYHLFLFLSALLENYLFFSLFLFGIFFMYW